MLDGRTRRAAAALIALAVAGGCASPATTGQAGTGTPTAGGSSATSAEPPPATMAESTATTSRSETEQIAATLSGGQLDAWASMAQTAIEWGDVFSDLDDLVDTSSAIFVGQVSGPAEERVFEDTETDDSFAYSVIPILVETPLGGRRTLDPGTTIEMVNLGGFPEDLVGSRVVWFLVNARDDPTSADGPNRGVDANPGEDDVYRFSPMAVWVDRGDGVPVAPVSEAERMPPSGDLEEYLFDEAKLPDETFHLANLQARSMTMDEFIAYVMQRSEANAD